MPNSQQMFGNYSMGKVQIQSFSSKLTFDYIIERTNQKAVVLSGLFFYFFITLTHLSVSLVLF